MIFQKIIKKIPKTKNPIIYISGFGSSGKTSFCKNFQEQHPNSIILSNDWFISETKTRKEKIKLAQISGDKLKIESEENPFNWYDWNEFLFVLQTLKSKKISTIRNAWNQKTGKKEIEIKLKCKDENTIILVEGVCLFDPNLQLFDGYKIWLDANLQTLKSRFYARDSHRNDEAYLSEKIRWFEIYELPLYDKYKKQADLIIDNTDYKDPIIL